MEEDCRFWGSWQHVRNLDWVTSDYIDAVVRVLTTRYWRTFYTVNDPVLDIEVRQKELAILRKLYRRINSLIDALNDRGIGVAPFKPHRFDEFGKKWLKPYNHKGLPPI